jgi:hypothetical protein
VSTPGVNQELFTAKYLWIQSVLSYITQPEYFLMKNLYSRRLELSNFKELATGIIRKIIAKASLAETPTLHPGEIEGILVEMIITYEKTFSVT